MSETRTAMIDPVYRGFSERLQQIAALVNGNAAEGRRLAAQANRQGAALARQQEMGQIMVAAIEVLDRKLERILLKLERRDG